MIVGLLSIFAAVVFWCLLGFVLQKIVDAAREEHERRTTPPPMDLWDPCLEEAPWHRYRLYGELLGSEEDPILNHWSAMHRPKDWGAGPYGDLSRSALRKAHGDP